jgi:hypothetical protein
MDKRYWKPTVAILGAFAGVWTIASLGASPAYASTDDNPAGASQCSAAVVNDAGTLAGTCLVSNARQAFVRLPSATSSTLMAPASMPLGSFGPPCGVVGINNGGAGSEFIIGSCTQGGPPQAVFWISGAPATEPSLLQPLGGLDPDVQTKATAVNLAGIIAGVSLNNTGMKTAVVWLSSTIPTALPTGPLLSSNSCAPVDIQDISSPGIVGNCDNNSPHQGPTAVLWQGDTVYNYTNFSSYMALPAPPNANFCRASAINFSGQILGQCVYADDAHRVVVWGRGGSGPTVLMTVGGATALRTFDAQISDDGVVVCNYLAGGASAGFKQPCKWDTTSGSTDALAISPPAGATGPAIAVSIGNNGKIAGVYETAGGVTHTFHVEFGSSVAVDDGSPAGGPNTILTSMSKSGANEAVVSEDSSEHTHVEAQAVP